MATNSAVMAKTPESIQRAKAIIAKLTIDQGLIDSINKQFREHKIFTEEMRKAIRPSPETLKKHFTI